MTADVYCTVLYQVMEAPSVSEIKFNAYSTPAYFDPDDTFPSNHKNLMGEPDVPILGRYNGLNYELAELLLVMTLPCRLEGGKCYYKHQQIHLPEKVIQILENIPELIPHNKSGKNKSNNHSNKQNQLYVDFHPELFQPRKDIVLKFLVSQTTASKPQQYLNYVCHNYIFRDFDFSVLKKHVDYVPCCIVAKTGWGVEETGGPYSISWEGLRSQNMSFHLKNECPAFSPNNMKIGINVGSGVAHFYSILLTTQEYTVNYHWHSLDSADVLKDIVKMSHSLNELQSNYEGFIGRNGALLELQRLLK